MTERSVDVICTATDEQMPSRRNRPKWRQALDMATPIGHCDRVAATLEHRSESASSATSKSWHIGRIALAVVLLVSLGAWWFAGGTFIGAPQGNRVGVAVRNGEDASFGFQLSADGDDAQLRSVSARVTPTATVEWSVYQATEGAGFGTWHGPLAPTWRVVPVDGAHVSQDAERSTWIIATVRSSKPGVYRISNITVRYQSGWRTRTERSGFTSCVLVAPANRSVDELLATDDPLWREYQACTTDG